MHAKFLQDTALRYFLEVVRCGSVSDAAVKLCVSPSAVSRQIAGLEEQLDVPLFERRPRGMSPSPAGERLAVLARRSALEAERTLADIQALRGLRRGLVRIASSAGFALEFLPVTIGSFQERYPGIGFQLQVYSSREVTTAVLRGDADVGLTYSRSQVQGIRVEHRQSAAVLAIMRPDHPLAGFPTVSLAQLQPHPIALPDRENTVREVFDIACDQRGLTFRPALVSGSFESLVSYVLATGALSISGELTVRHRIARAELHGAVIRESNIRHRNIEVQTLGERTLPAVVQTFVDFLRDRLPMTKPHALDPLVV